MVLHCSKHDHTAGYAAKHIRKYTLHWTLYWLVIAGSPLLARPTPEQARSTDQPRNIAERGVGFGGEGSLDFLALEWHMFIREKIYLFGSCLAVEWGGRRHLLKFRSASSVSGTTMYRSHQQQIDKGDPYPHPTWTDKRSCCSKMRVALHYPCLAIWLVMNLLQLEAINVSSSMRALCHIQNIWTKVPGAGWLYRVEISRQLRRYGHYDLTLQLEMAKNLKKEINEWVTMGGWAAVRGDWSGRLLEYPEPSPRSRDGQRQPSVSSHSSSLSYNGRSSMWAGHGGVQIKSCISMTLSFMNFVLLAPTGALYALMH